MNILITGAAGFLGKNLVENLKAIRDGKNRTRPALSIGEIFAVTRGILPEQLAECAAKADFVFHFAGVNRPEDPADFQRGNVGFTAQLLAALRKAGNTCPVLFSSSLQATLAGRFTGSLYGRSKRDAEDLLFHYAAETGARVYVYRLPNLVGKWIRPDYNSAVATFCHHIARDEPITVTDPSIELELLFIDDLLEELYDALEGHPHVADDPRFCACAATHRATLGEIVTLLKSFRAQPETLLVPTLTPGSFEKKLYSMYISYLPERLTAFPLTTHADARGSFTELLKSRSAGQVSVNITKPGVTKGQHWHNSKLEQFIVVSGRGRIRMRDLASGETREFDVSGEKIESVQMLPGWTHSIENLSETEDLVTIMWANEVFDPARPDTFFEEV